MNSDEYMRRLDIAEKSIEKNDLKKAEKILDELSEYIPVRLRFYLVKAKLLAFKQEYSAAADLLCDKCDWYGDSPEKSEFLKALEYYYTQANNKVKAAWVKQAAVWPDIDEQASLQLNEAEEAFLNNPNDVSVQYRLFGLYLKNRLLTQAAVFAVLLQKNNDIAYLPDDASINLIFTGNRGYLADWLRKGDAVFFLDADDTRTCFDSHVMPVSLAIYLLGSDIFWLGEEVECPVSDISLLSETVHISLENAEDMNIAKLLRTVKATFNGNGISNETLLIDAIIKNYPAAFYLGSGTGLEALQCNVAEYKNFIWRLSPYEHPYGEKQLCFSALGSYTYFKSAFYGFDVAACIEAVPEYDFSIVVPVRDSADTLKYTLDTCLNQDYDGSFEVLVSDNSVKSDAVEKLCKSINNPHLRYIRTPLNFSLAYSFEYAFLQAKGNFILSVGADDGVMPWALSTIANASKKVSEAQLFLWPRGSYVWPTSPIKEQRNLFILYLNSIENGSYISTQKTSGILKQVLDNPSTIYSIPLLYTNSGFKHSYIKYMLQKTGRLWNGTAQDIYMGIQTLAVNEKIYSLSVPLTIAGASGNSIGANLNAGTHKYRVTDTYGYPFICTLERKIPTTRNDIRAVYASLLRLISEGLYSADYEKLIDYDHVLELIFSQLTKSDALFEVYLQRAISGLSALASPEMRDKINSEVIPQLITPELKEKTDTSVRKYNIGYSTNSGLFLDASVFDITDIKGAVKLAEKLYMGKVY